MTALVGWHDGNSADCRRRLQTRLRMSHTDEQSTANSRGAAQHTRRTERRSRCGQAPGGEMT